MQQSSEVLMELEGVGQGLEGLEKGTLNESFLEGDIDARSKTSLRMHYEAQVSVIQNQIGNLEEIRASLGLSQRKMAQLLLVDPSTWTRWTKNGDEAPPHIWRALQWYAALKEKIPGLTPHYFIGTNPQTLHQKALKELDLERQERQQNMSDLALKLDNLSAERDFLGGELLRMKKELKFYRNMTIFVLSLGISWAALLWFWKSI
jgi:transcriptional regulator with XRE-family HTH domain